MVPVRDGVEGMSMNWAVWNEEGEEEGEYKEEGHWEWRRGKRGMETKR